MLTGLNSTATRVSLGTMSASIWRRLGPLSFVITEGPVMLAAGRARLAMNPSLTASPPARPITIGIVLVALCAASIGCVPEARMRPTLACTSWFARPGRRAGSLSAKR